MNYRSRLAWTPGALDRSSVFPAIALLLAAIGFGASRDFGAFLLALIVLPCLALATLVWIVVAAMAPGRRATWIGVAAAIALSALPAFLIANAFRDRVRFIGWALTHRPANTYTRHDGVITDWDSWGMAGMGNDSYLVADTSDTIGTVAAADQWRRRRGISCEIVDSRRMMARLYIVTTANCPFNFDGRRWS